MFLKKIAKKRLDWFLRRIKKKYSLPSRYTWPSHENKKNEKKKWKEGPAVEEIIMALNLSMMGGGGGGVSNRTRWEDEVEVRAEIELRVT